MYAGQFGVPGQTAILESAANEFLWGGDASRIMVLQTDTKVLGAARDAGNSPTNVLRPGLLMGQVSASGGYMQYDPTATDGTQFPVGPLPVELKMIDIDGNNVDRHPPVIVRAPIKAANVYILGVALTSSDYQYLARRQLATNGFIFNDDPRNFLSGLARRTITKATNYTVVATDNGTLFQAITADATFTLPALATSIGTSFTFQRCSDHEMVVASAEGDNMVVGNDLSADSITFTTASEHIGAQIHVEAMLVNGTAKWVVTLPHVPFGTGVNTLTYGIAT